MVDKGCKVSIIPVYDREKYFDNLRCVNVTAVWICVFLEVIPFRRSLSGLLRSA